MFKKNMLFVMFVVFLLNSVMANATIEDEVANLTRIVLALQVPIIENNATVVYLKKDCGSSDNCFDTVGELQNWVWSTRNPDASKPLLVEIGPGIFQGRFTCKDKGNVTLRGSGMQNTILEYNGGGLPTEAVITTVNCNNMVFSDMTIRNTNTALATQTLGGTTTWNNIEIDAEGYGWIDDFNYKCEGPIGKHYWFNSRISAHVGQFGISTAYYNACDESWIYGSELTSVGSKSSFFPILSVVARGGEVHVYGSVIRALTNDSQLTIGGLIAASTVDNEISNSSGEIHIHGTGIDVISAGDSDIVALSASMKGVIHASQSSYVLKTNGGIKERIKLNGGTIMAPYQWHQSSEPPKIISVSGADTYVETDCPITGDCSLGGVIPRTMIYLEACAGNGSGPNNGPWFDTVTNACRQ